jgi:hypothetical protein
MPRNKYLNAVPAFALLKTSGTPSRCVPSQNYPWSSDLITFFSSTRTMQNNTTTLVSRVAQSVWCLATGWTTERSRFDLRQRQRIFPLASVSRPALGPTQPPVQWVPGVLSTWVKSGRGVTLTTHPI